MTLYAWLNPRWPNSPTCDVFVRDGSGYPQPCQIVGPDGFEVYSDMQGRAMVPREWLRNVVSVRHHRDGREITRVRLLLDDRGEAMLTVPRGNDTESIR